jgi:alkyldihydroxyacetonephosphate synthase
MSALIDDLARILGADAVSEGSPERRAYARDLWPRYLIAARGGLPLPEGPRAVVWPRRDEQVSAVLRYAKARGVRVSTVGGGSGVCGMTAVEGDTIVMDTKRMRAVHEVDVPRGRAVIDAGILGQPLEDALLARGATLGHYPSSIACSTLGGWIVTRGAGQCSGRYGKIDDMVLGLEGVTPDGEPFTAGVPAPGEPDARALFTGSEGLFGVVTRAHVRVWPAPVERRTLSMTFATLAQAWDAVRAVYQSGLRPAVSRVYDPFDSHLFRTGRSRARGERTPVPSSRRAIEDWMVRRAARATPALNALNTALGERLFGRSLLILVFERCEGEAIDGPLELARRACLACGGEDQGDAPGQRWLARRHSVSFRQPGTFARGLWVDTMEVAATWARFQALYDGVREALSEGGFVMAHMSHAYPDGCSIYFTFVGASPSDARAMDTHARTWARALEAAHRAGGTIAHHHGIGRSKRGAMRLEHGAGVTVLARLARAADPGGVLAGGPLLPEDGEGFESPSIAPGSDRIAVDPLSELVTAPASAPLADVRRALSERGLTLDGAPMDGSVGEWLRTTPSAEVRRDPVSHRVAGYVARTAEGGRAWWLPAPRRSAGPELWTLFASQPERWGPLESVTLAARRVGAEPSFTAPFEPRTTEEIPTSPGVRAWIARASEG